MKIWSQIYVSFFIQRMFFIIIFEETVQFRKDTNYGYNGSCRTCPESNIRILSQEKLAEKR